MANDPEMEKIVQKLNARRAGGGCCGPQAASANDGDEKDDELAEAKEIILQQEDALVKFLSQPLIHATILSEQSALNVDAFQNSDNVVVIDEDSEYFKRVGRICSKFPVVDMASGTVRVDIYGIATKNHFRIGINGDKPQIKLLNKNDGTDVTIACDGKIYKIWRPQKDLKFTTGDTALVNLVTNQIVDVTPTLPAGDPVEILKYNKKNNTAVVNIGGMDKSVLISDKIKELNEGDKVLLDRNYIIIVEKLESSTKYSAGATGVSWNDIGGQDKAKNELIEAIETPYKYKDIYKKYNQLPPKGLLLYGPPGCGKTLLGKAAATSVAQIHGGPITNSSFLYIKAPELLSMWVSKAEANVQALFRGGRNHYEKHGYPQVCFIDEADSILMERGSELEKWRDTFVAMWLAEMDGLQENNMIVIFATNRQASMDGAILRDGRIDCHIHVPRPGEKEALSILNIHLATVPLCGLDTDEAAAYVMADLFNSNKVVKKISANKKEYSLTYKDCMNGAILAGVIKKAKQLAIRRDIGKGCFGGVTIDDLLAASSESYKSHLNLNHEFEIEDFCSTHNINRKEVKVI